MGLPAISSGNSRSSGSAASRGQPFAVYLSNKVSIPARSGHGTWHEFVQRHIKTLWATDFFTKTVWTLRGPVTYYVLFFIHLHTRRVHIAGMTPNPDGVWMAQVARNMSMVFGEERPESPWSSGTSWRTP